MTQAATKGRLKPIVGPILLLIALASLLVILGPKAWRELRSSNQASRAAITLRNEVEHIVWVRYGTIAVCRAIDTMTHTCIGSDKCYRCMAHTVDDKDKAEGESNFKIECATVSCNPGAQCASEQP